jgi:hypothetical protein
MAAWGADLRTPAVLVLATAVGIWPYVGTLGYGPMTLDAVHWIQRGSPDTDAPWRWIFASAHFIAYRPVNALSFWLTGAFGGPDGWHRLFDLAVHVINGVLVHRVARRLPGLGRWGAVLAAGIFLCHPVTEDVVPWLARRHYGLATGFSLGALLWVSRSLAANLAPFAAQRHALVGAACLLAAIGSNEVAFTTAAVLPAWAWITAAAERRDPRGVLRACAPSLVAAVVALWVRSFLIDGVGGYTPDASPGRFAAVYVGFWRDLVAFDPDYSGVRSGLRSTLLVAGGLGLAGSAAYTLLAARSGRQAGLPLLVLLGWLIFASVLLCAQNVWFTRELLPLIPALALWISLTLGDALAWRRVWALAPALVLLTLALHSPALRGPDRVRLARWSETQAVLDDVTAALDAAPAPTWIGLGLGYTRERRHGSVRAHSGVGQPPRFLRLAPLWLGPRYAETGHRLETLIALPGTRDAPAEATIFAAHGDQILRVPAERSIERFAGIPAPHSDDAGGQLMRLHTLPRPAGLTAYFYLRVGGKSRFVTLRTRRP